MAWVYGILIPFFQGIVFMWGCVVSAIGMHCIYERFFNKDNKKDGYK